MVWNRKEIKQYSKKMLNKDYWKTFSISTLNLSLSSITIASIIYNSSRDIPKLIQNIFNSEFRNGNVDIKIVMILITFLSCLSILMLMIRALINIFITNPFQVGMTRYMKNTLKQDKQGKISDVVHVFDENYFNCIKVMFIYNLVLTIGGILFVVPGIYFSYKYRMVPYLLDNEPSLTVKEAFDKSAKIMEGNKLQSLILDLSFIPLYILGTITVGIVELFYVEPYKNLVDAQLYLKLTERNEEE